MLVTLEQVAASMARDLIERFHAPMVAEMLRLDDHRVVSEWARGEQIPRRDRLIFLAHAWAITQVIGQQPVYVQWNWWHAFDPRLGHEQPIKLLRSNPYRVLDAAFDWLNFRDENAA